MAPERSSATAGRVFISCGQNSRIERDVARRVTQLLLDRGYSPYVAIQAQSLADVNSGIIQQLEDADYYIFIDFRRERVRWFSKSPFRGSLFTHQELAIAHRAGFDHVLLFQEQGVLLEGLLRYWGGNAITFTSRSEVPAAVIEAIEQRRWLPTYSRHLIATRPRWEQHIIRTPQITGRFLFVDIENRRPTTAAHNTTARLDTITAPDGAVSLSTNRSPLKVTGQRAYAQDIWPGSHGAVDALAVGIDQPHAIFLHTSLDVPRVAPIITAPGRYLLEYSVIASNFPNMRFTVELDFTGSLVSTSARLRV
jgi:hypothetical protein